MSFWMRSGTLQVGPYKYSLDDLVFAFEVPFEDSEQLMVTKITIYNLSEATRNSIRKNHPLIIDAGYEGDIGVIFVGKISSISSKHQGLEWITTLTATEAMEEWFSKKVNKTYAAGIDAKSIIKDLLKIFEIEVSRIELAVNKTYPRGKVCNGPVRSQLKEIITSDCKSIFLVRHGQVIIRDPGKGTPHGGAAVTAHRAAALHRGRRHHRYHRSPGYPKGQGPENPGTKNHQAEKPAQLPHSTRRHHPHRG